MSKQQYKGEKDSGQEADSESWWQEEMQKQKRKD